MVLPISCDRDAGSATWPFLAKVPMLDFSSADSKLVIYPAVPSLGQNILFMIYEQIRFPDASQRVIETLKYS